MGSPDTKKASKDFGDSISKSFSINDKNFMKGIPLAFVNSNDSDNELDYSKVDSNQTYYNSTTLENYFNNNEVAFTSFVDFYIRNTPYVVVTFHDRKVITQIAPTLSQLLKITQPNGTESEVLTEILNK
jgi:hypothetical protein